MNCMWFDVCATLERTIRVMLSVSTEVTAHVPVVAHRHRRQRLQRAPRLETELRREPDVTYQHN